MLSTQALFIGGELDGREITVEPKVAFIKSIFVEDSDSPIEIERYSRRNLHSGDQIFVFYAQRELSDSELVG